MDGVNNMNPSRSDGFISGTLMMNCPQTITVSWLCVSGSITKTLFLGKPAWGTGPLWQVLPNYRMLNLALTV